MSVRLVFAVPLLVIMLSSLSAMAKEDLVACQNGLLEHECPMSAPVCCRQVVTGVLAACCPLGTYCDMADATCIADKNGTKYRPAGSKPEPASGVNVGIAEAAIILTFLFIFLVVGAVLCSTAGCRIQRRVLAVCVRRQRERLLAELEQAEKDNRPEEVSDSDVEEVGMCSLCYTTRVSAVLMPCGHVCTCFACAQKLEKKKCPMCRKPVEKFLHLKNKLFLANPARLNHKTRSEMSMDTRREETNGGDPPSHREEEVDTAEPQAQDEEGVTNDTHTALLVPEGNLQQQEEEEATTTVADDQQTAERPIVDETTPNEGDAAAAADGEGDAQ